MIDELSLLREHRVAQPPPDRAVRETARAALAAAIGVECARDPRPRRSRAWYRSAWMLRLGPVVLVALAATLLLGPWRAGTPIVDRASAAVLERLARVAAAQPANLPAAGQYLFTRSRSAYAVVSPPCVAIEPSQREAWIGADGSGLLRDTPLGHVRYPSASDREACASQPSRPAPARSRSDVWSAPGCLSLAPVDLSKLPLDPAALREQLETGKIEGGPSGAAEAFVQVGDLLRKTDASPVLRAALYRAAAGLPGVRLLGRVTDPVGRPGIALAHVDIAPGAILNELIFDPHTSALLAERQTIIRAHSGFHALVGTVIGSAVYLTSRIVDRLPAGGPGALSPPCSHGAGVMRPYPGHANSMIAVGHPTTSPNAPRPRR